MAITSPAASSDTTKPLTSTAATGHGEATTTLGAACSSAAASTGPDITPDSESSVQRVQRVTATVLGVELAAAEVALHAACATSRPPAIRVYERGVGGVAICFSEDGEKQAGVSLPMERIERHEGAGSEASDEKGSVHQDRKEERKEVNEVRQRARLLLEEKEKELSKMKKQAVKLQVRLVEETAASGSHTRRSQ